MPPHPSRQFPPASGAASARVAVIACAAALALADTARPDGIFLPTADGAGLWRQTLDTVAADWPIVRVVAPDFTAAPPRDGLIESAWVEPAGGGWPPRRRRVVVRMAPTAGGAWVNAGVETQSLTGAAAGGTGIELVGDWRPDGAAEDASGLTSPLAAVVPAAAVRPLPPLESEIVLASREPPWAGARHPQFARAGYLVLEDYRNFYSCESLVCLTAAFGAGAIMANTDFDVTMQNAWQKGVEPNSLGTFFSGCKDIGDGWYALPIFGAAAATGLVFEGHPAGDVIGEWGSRSLRMFIVGAPPLYVMQWVTGGSRPGEGPAGSSWHMFNDDNGVSGHAFVGAVPFLAAADMVESPLLKGTLYVCSTFVGFSRMTDNMHYPSQAFLGWYLALASARAVSATQTHFAGMEVSIVPLPMADLGGMAVETRW